MSDELRFGYQVRQILDRGASELDQGMVLRLRAAREAALECHRIPVAELTLATAGRMAVRSLSGHAKAVLATLALVLGAGAAYYWDNGDQASERQASEYAQLDSALLADELPFSAYLDQGFMEWLNHVSQEEDSLPQ